VTDQSDMDAQLESAMRRLADLRLSEQARQRHLSMLAELADADLSGVAGNTAKRRSRRGVLVVATAAIVASGVGVGTAAALGVFRSAPPTDRHIAHCYTTADINDPSNHEDIAVGVGTGGGNPSLRDAATAALDICRGGWMQGRYRATDPKILLDPKSSPWDYPVPHLTVCVLKSGQVGVFPGTEATCAELGLPVAEL
jgi:hypothetical protein